jgi:hypothetical protein
VKSDSDTTNSAQVIRTTTTRQILPADSVSEPKGPDFWTYLAELEKTPEQWERHLLYLYRIVAETGPMLPLDKISRYLDMGNSIQVPIGDREEFEFALKRKYGGGNYRMILKKGSERYAEARIRIDGPPKPIALDSTQPTISSVPNENTTAEVAKQAMQHIASHESEAISVGVNAMRGAAEVIQRLASQSAAPAPPVNPVTDRLIELAITRLLNPPDPLELLTKLMTLQQSFTVNAAGGGATGPIVEKILESGLERILNPVPTSPTASPMSALVGILPQVSGHAKEAVHEWRLGSEAQRDTALLMTTGKLPQQPTSLPPGATAAPNPVPQPTAAPIGPAAAAPAPANGTPPQTIGPSQEWVESKIAEIITDLENSPAEAADETIEFLNHISPLIVQQLISSGEQGVLLYFQTRPALGPTVQNLPRLQEFIKAFFKYATEEVATPAAGANGGVVHQAPQPN